MEKFDKPHLNKGECARKRIMRVVYYKNRRKIRIGIGKYE